MLDRDLGAVRAARRTMIVVGLLGAAALAACGSDVVPDATGTSGAGGAGGGTGGSGETTAVTSSASGGDVLGATCDAEGSLRCSDDAEGEILGCSDGRYVRLGACDAGTACHDVQGADSVACDDTFLGVEGAPCVGGSTAVCDFARDVVLGCDAGRWTAFTHCAPTSCAHVAPAPDRICSGMACETCGYTLGDRCDFLPGTVNCSTTGTAIVACESGVVTLYQDCAATGQACTVNGGIVECL